MNYKKIGIGIGVSIIIGLIIFIVIRSIKKPTRSNCQCSQTEKCINGQCVSLCGTKKIPADAPWYIQQSDLFCGNTDSNTISDWSYPDFCNTQSLKNSLKCYDGKKLFCNDTGYYCSNDCNGKGTKYLKYKDISKKPDQSCNCQTGYAGDQCQFSNDKTCSNNGIVNTDGSCVCNQDYYGTNCSIFCPAPSNVFDGNGCSCAPGYNSVNGQCQPINECNQLGKVVDGKCVCDPGNITDPNNTLNCIKCQNNTTSNSDGTACILPNPEVTTEHIYGCDSNLDVMPNKYTRVNYIYGQDASKSTYCYYDVSNHTLSNKDIDNNGICKCDPETDGIHCENNGYYNCSGCQGSYSNNSCSCKVSSDLSSNIKGCDSNDIWYKNTYYTRNDCSGIVSCYGPTGLTANDALNTDGCKCVYNNKTGCSCPGGGNPNTGCSITIGEKCNGNGSINCTDGSCNCGANREGKNCQCDISSFFNTNNSAILTGDNICNSKDNINIYKCSDQKEDGSKDNYYYLTKPSTCDEYNSYLMRLRQFGILNDSNICGKLCLSTEIGPICTDTINGPEFNCIQTCQNQPDPSCGKDETIVCDVTTKYKKECVKTTDIFNVDTSNTQLNPYIPPNFSDYCPGADINNKNQSGVWNVRACNLIDNNTLNTGYFANCLLPGYYTIPKKCVTNTTTPYTEVETSDGNKYDKNIYYKDNTQAPIYPTYYQFYRNKGNGDFRNPQSGGSVTTNQLSISDYAGNADLSWMINNPKGHLIDITGGDWKN